MARENPCSACNAPIPPNPRGRPRKYCRDCVPPGSGRAAMVAWRAVNPERVAAYNAARRGARGKGETR